MKRKGKIIFYIVGVLIYLNALIFETIYLLSASAMCDTSYMWMAIVVSTVALLLHCIFFMRCRKRLAVSLVAILMIVFSLASFAASINADIEYENPNYAEELKQNEKEYRDALAQIDEVLNNPGKHNEISVWYAKRQRESLRIEYPDTMITHPNLETATIGVSVSSLSLTSYYGISIVVIIIKVIIDASESKRAKHQNKKNLLAREKAYAQIDKFHDYLERDVITQEEYEDNRRKILEALE